MSNDRIFSGKTAVITGGASGIGAALGEELSRLGALVVLADVDGARAQETARRIGQSAEGTALDVTDAAAVEDLVTSTASKHGPLDYFFNNAGINVIGDALKTPLADWLRVIDVNLKGVVHGIVAAYPLMARQGHGHIVNTASAQGLGPAPGAAAYTATKFAVVGLSAALREEAAAKGVRVSVACPGFVDTPIRDNSKYIGMDRKKFERATILKPMQPTQCAHRILEGVRRNHAIIPVSVESRALWLAWRLAPESLIAVMGRVYSRQFGN